MSAVPLCSWSVLRFTWAPFSALLMALSFPWSGCADDSACSAYQSEAQGVVTPRLPGETRWAYSRRMGDALAAIGLKYGELRERCRLPVARAVGRRLVDRCAASPNPARPPRCPDGWSSKRCCELAAACLLEPSLQEPFCGWVREIPPLAVLPRCTTCPSCAREGTNPPEARPIDLWLGGDGETLAVVLDRPVNDSWFLPPGAPVAHLEGMLYALSVQPGYLAPSAAIVRGEVVSVDGWNTLEQAFHGGGWGRLGLNLGQWQGKLRCPSRPPVHLHRFPPGRSPVTLRITSDALILDGKPVIRLKDGHPVGESRGKTGGFLIAPLRDALQALPRSGGRVDVVRIGLLRGVTVDARLVAGIIYTASQVLAGAHARIICLDNADVR